MAYEVRMEGMMTLALHGQDGTRLVGVPIYEAPARDAIYRTCEELNAGNIAEDEAHAFCNRTYKELLSRAYSGR